MKPRLVYINPDCFSDTDITVVGYLAQHFELRWYEITYNDRPTNLSRLRAEEIATHSGADLRIIERRYRQRDPRNYFFYKELVKEICDFHPDLVYSCCFEIYWLMASKQIRSKYKTVYGVHDVDHHSDRLSIRSLGEALFCDFAVRLHKNVVTFSENQKNLFERKYGRSCCNVGMSHKDFGESNAKPADIAIGTELLFFGSIIKYKGLDLLIDAIEELHAEGICNLHLTIAGKGSHWEECKKHILTPGLYDMQIRFVANEEVPDLMCSHHFLVLPYRDATQSGPLLTAARYKLPVIAPDYGCFSETFDKSSAILYSSNQLKDALLNASCIDCETYSRIKENCEAVYNKTSEAQIAQKYIDQFTKVLSS